MYTYTIHTHMYVYTTYTHMYAYITHTHTHSHQTVRTLVISEGAECEKLHAVLKDLTSILQALGRLAEHFIGDRFHSRQNEAQLLVKRFCMLAEYSTNTVLFNVVNPMPEILDHDFIEL